MPIPHQFAALLEVRVREWPRPLERLVIVARSMGGLVARSAIHHAALAGHSWSNRLDDLVLLGTPHFGAALERAGARADFLLGICPYTAPFARPGKVRSAGIKDLRHGNLRNDAGGEHSDPRPRAGNSLPLPKSDRCYAIAASRLRHGTFRSVEQPRGLRANPALAHQRSARQGSPTHRQRIGL